MDMCIISRIWSKIMIMVVIAIAAISFYFNFTLLSHCLGQLNNLANNEGKHGETTPAAGKDVGDTPFKFSAPFNNTIMQVGAKRTATTTQFECLCMSLFLKLEKWTDRSNQLECKYIAIEGLKSFDGISNYENPLVFKIHENEKDGFSLDKLPIDQETMKNMWVFSTAISKEKAGGTRTRLEQIGFKNVIYVQDMETLAERGHHIADIYAGIFELDATQKNDLLEYIRYWDILRICCGKQMSRTWRMEQWPDSTEGKGYVDVHAPNYHMCSAYNIDEVERLFTNTHLYRRIMAKETLIREMARPSLLDGEVWGTYCSKYNDLVKNEGVDTNQGDVQKSSSAGNHTQRF